MIEKYDTNLAGDYKLRIYWTHGPNKGNVIDEEFFRTKEDMESRYKQLFKRELYGLNPTAWTFDGTSWHRIAGF